MVSNARFINWENIEEAFPAFITIALMPLTYSISNGLLAGLAATFALWLLETATEVVKAVLGKSHDRTPGTFEASLSVSPSIIAYSKPFAMN